MKRSGIQAIVSIVTAIILIPSLILAFVPPPRPGSKPRPPQPPQNQTEPNEAIVACRGHNVGDKVQFQTLNGTTVFGVCTEVKGRLIAVPSDPSDPNDNDPTPGDDNTGTKRTYTVIDTNQSICYDESFSMDSCPGEWDAYYGQDAQHDGTQPHYTDNSDGTVSDNNTDLMWQQNPGAKMTFDQAVAGAESFNLAGYDDWRLPTIKELYSLILFSGTDPKVEDTDTTSLIPFIDSDLFSFEYGDTSIGERIIDAQYVSSTKYVTTTMNGNETVFGVNFADGRIKGYGTNDPSGRTKEFFVLYVRGNDDYGINDFVDNGDGTVTDAATELMWMQVDSGSFGTGNFSDGALNWEQSLSWCEDLVYSNYSDWRLPNTKELQSIVDYSRSPYTTLSAAIDPLFTSAVIANEKGELDYAHYWTSTTHAKADEWLHAGAVYIAFGRAMGFMGEWLDVHGAGAQRSDPKSGDPDYYPEGRGPQGDAVRIYNYARCVR